MKIERKSTSLIDNKEKNRIFNFYKKYFSPHHWNKKYFNQFTKDNQRQSLILVAETNSNNLAGLILGRRDKNNKYFFNLSIIVVDFKYRKKGIATKLMKELISNLSKGKTKKIIIHFREKNNLKNFYQKFGFCNFKIIGKYNNGDNKCFMELKIV